MDNKQVIEWLEYIKSGYDWFVNCDLALNKAIAIIEILEQVIEIVYSDDYPEDKEAKLIELLQEYRG